MPEIKTGKKREEFRDKIVTAKQKSEEKKNKGGRLTVQDIEERLTILEETVIKFLP